MSYPELEEDKYYHPPIWCSFSYLLLHTKHDITDDMIDAWFDAKERKEGRDD